MGKEDYEYIIEKLQLEPHPEGGYFRETYRSSLEFDFFAGADGVRNCSTGIYFLLTSENRSHLHRIQSDEVWHFYQGDPLNVVMLTAEGDLSVTTLGQNMDTDERFQFVVPAGAWFGAEVAPGGRYSLVGCTVAPGFDFKDFELAKKEEMVQLYPQHKEFLNAFCLR